MPDLLLSNDLYWIAYCDLLNKWPAGKIPPSEILAFAEITGLNKTELYVKINAIENRVLEIKEKSDGNNSSTTAS